MTQKRTITVWLTLILCMSASALLLMTLDNNRPSGGAYSLASYLRLNPVEQAVLSPIIASPAQWNRIEIFYSRTASGNAADLAVVSNLRGTPRADFHFVVCNGKGAENGHIQFTENWKNQLTSTGIVRICVIADAYQAPATDYQLRRTVSLVDVLSRKFGIDRSYIHYPPEWQI